MMKKKASDDAQSKKGGDVATQGTARTLLSLSLNPALDSLLSPLTPKTST